MSPLVRYLPNQVNQGHNKIKIKVGLLHILHAWNKEYIRSGLPPFFMVLHSADYSTDKDSRSGHTCTSPRSTYWW